MKAKIQIPSTTAIRRLNNAIQEADRVSGYRFDQLEPGELIRWLTAGGRLGLAIELQAAAHAVECENQVLTENSNLS